MLFFFLPLAVCLVTAPLLTHRMMEASYQRSREQIAVDNAAIIFGQEISGLVRAIGAFETERVGKEARHHLVHGNEPTLDTQSEAELDLWIDSKMEEFHFRWRRAFVLAQEKAAEMKIRIGFEGVSSENVILERSFCHLCAEQFVVRWIPGRLPIRGRIFSISALRAGVGFSIDRDYRLLE